MAYFNKKPTYLVGLFFVAGPGVEPGLGDYALLLSPVAWSVGLYHLRLLWSLACSLYGFSDWSESSLGVDLIGVHRYSQMRTLLLLVGGPTLEPPVHRTLPRACFKEHLNCIIPCHLCVLAGYIGDTAK